MISIWKPLAAHSPWSGGSRENWLPLFASRLWRWFSPSNELRTESGPLLETPTPEASGDCGTFGDVCWIERDRLTLKKCDVPVALSTASPSAGPSSFGCTSASGAGALGEYDVTPDELICRLTPAVVEALAGGTATAIPATTASDVRTV